MPRRTLLLVTGLACLATLLNAVKPLALDDTVYFEYVRQIQEHPLDPYGFRLAGGQPANEVLAPPGFLYWWAATRALAGDRPVAWKLGLFPFTVAFALALAALARRFARGLELPLVVFVLFSPAVLPCFNLMLDVPALTLSLLALVVFLRARERGSAGTALAAGLLAGLAMQTKYTALVMPALFLLADFRRRRPGPGVLAAAAAVAVFASWEAYVAATYGDSHFLLALRERNRPWAEKLRLVQPLVGLLGATASAGILLGLAARGTRREVVRRAALALLAGYLLVFLAARPAMPAGGRPGLPLHTVWFACNGLLLIALTGAAAARLARDGAAGDGATDRDCEANWFLLAWLLLELGGYFALSPYPAVRRVLGLVVVSALLLARQAARAAPGGTDRGPAWTAAVVSGLLGLVFFFADFEPYRVEEIAARRAVRLAHERDPRARIWYSGFGAFEFYGGRLGMCRREPGGPRPSPGDWQVALTRRGGCGAPAGDADGPEISFALDGFLPLASRYQVGGSGLEPYSGPFVEVHLRRITSEPAARAAR